jgi:hypothetical protein
MGPRGKSRAEPRHGRVKNYRHTPRATQRDGGAQPAPTVPLCRCAARGCARRLGRFRRPCIKHRVHDLANIRGKYGFTEYQKSLELLEIGNS